MKHTIDEKRYKRHTLKKRITRLMRFSNSISVLILVVMITILFGGLMSFVGQGFTHYTAKQMASDLEFKYKQAMNDEEFESFVTSGAKDRDKMKQTMEMENLNAVDLKSSILRNLTFFEYVITYQGEEMYDSFKEGRDNSFVDHFNDQNLIGVAIFNETVVNYLDRNHNVIGQISVRLSPDIIGLLSVSVIGFGVFIFLINLIVSKVISVVVASAVAKPLETLTKQMVDLSNDDLEIAINSHLIIKNPISEVKSLNDSTSKIMGKMAEYYELMTAQNEELEAQRDELESQNEQLTETGQSLQSMNNAYLSRTLKLQNLLDNVGQGFITFNESLIINSEYSLACESLVSKEEGHSNLTGQKVTDVIFDDPEQKDFVEALLKKIIKGTPHERDLFLPLLPEEMVKNDKIQNVAYKMVKDENFKEQMMIILTDITQSRELEKQVINERDCLQMIVKVVLNREDFLSLLEDYQEFLASDFIGLNPEDYEENLRMIHTFKGSFAQYYMNNTADLLNEIEDLIYADGHIDSIHKLDNVVMKSELAKDLAIIEGYVGKEFISDVDMFTVKESTILDIEMKIKKILPSNEYKKILPIIQSIRYKSIKEGLKNYPEYTTKLSERMGKSIAPFDIQGDDVYVDFDIYQPILKSFIHVFRNAVDHGIEDGDERIEVGKNEVAKITCEIIKHAETFDIIVEDDGKGLDIDGIKRKAIEKGMIANEATILSKDALIAMIFEPGITMKESATAISGRGIGLSALKESISALNGQIVVQTRRGSGTTFKITLPIVQGVDILEIGPEVLMDRIQEVTQSYMKVLNIDIGRGVKRQDHRISLENVSALINIKGSIEGMIAISANELLSKAFVKAFIIDEVDDSLLESYAEDVLGEITNTILGNVLGKLEQEGIYLSMGIPVMISNSNAYMKYSERQILTMLYENTNYKLGVNLLMLEENETLNNNSKK